MEYEQERKLPYHMKNLCKLITRIEKVERRGVMLSDRSKMIHDTTQMDDSFLTFARKAITCITSSAT